MWGNGRVVFSSPLERKVSRLEPFESVLRATSGYSKRLDIPRICRYAHGILPPNFYESQSSHCHHITIYAQDVWPWEWSRKFASSVWSRTVWEDCCRAFGTMSLELLRMAEVTKMVTSPRSVHEIRRVGVMTDQCAAQSARVDFVFVIFHPFLAH